MTDSNDENSDGPTETYPLSVERQTPLSETIKIRWDQSQRTHAKMVHSLGCSFADASEDEPLIGAGVRAMTRQKTQIVVETVEEAESLLYELNQYCHPYGLEPPHGANDRPYHRVRDELRAELGRLGYTIDESEFRPAIALEAPKP